MLNHPKSIIKFALFVFAFTCSCKSNNQTVDNNKPRKKSEAANQEKKSQHSVSKKEKPKKAKKKIDKKLNLSKQEVAKYKKLKGELLKNSKDIATHINNFNFKLYQELTRKKPVIYSGPHKANEVKNLVFSPWSLHLSLSMLAAGAQGKTLQELVDVLDMPAKNTSYHQDYKHLILNLILNSTSENFLLQQSNCLWVEKSSQLKSSFARTLSKNYQGSITPLDFKNKLKKSRKTINEFVKKQTNGKIANILAPDSLNILTKIVLTNAIYLKGKWSQKFKKEKNIKTPFHLLNGKKIQVTSMNREVFVRMHKNQEITALELPYKNKRFSLLVVMPSLSGFSQVEKKLSTEYLNKIINSLEKKGFNLYLPKFKINFKFNPKTVLKNMGMRAAFSLKADFGKIFSNEDVMVNSIAHKAFIEVNEAGTEAAAATAVAVATKGIPQPNPRVVKINRPFFFFIRDHNSGAILFTGRQLNPAKSN